MPDSEKKLFLLDAFALIYRAYFAFSKNPRYNSRGLNTSAILGFTNTLYDVLRKEKPTHIAVCFDMAGPTTRHTEFTEYKANREAMPEDLASALPYIRKVIEAFNIPILEEEGYEADDVIGTLAKHAEKNGYITYMMTPDKDYGQLVSEKIFIYKPGRGGGPEEVWGIKEVCEKFEITDPLQVIDILGLWGDAVDNIPGVPGVGEKTAKKLIGEYGSIENLYEHTADLKGKLRENVENNKENALLSKSLATIILDVPLSYTEESLVLEEPDKDKLKDLFAELEFKQLAQKILGEELSFVSAAGTNGQTDLFADGDAEIPEAIEAKTIADVPHEYFLVKTAPERAELVAKLAKEKKFCFDTETTGLDPITAELVGIAFSSKAGVAHYVAIPENIDEAHKITNEFKALLEDPNTEKIGHNIKYDIQVLRKYGIAVAGTLFDSMLAHYLLRPDMRHNMDLLAETYLQYLPVSIETLIGKKGKEQRTMRQLPPEDVYEYACEDADITLQLSNLFAPMLQEEGVRKLFDEIEMPLVQVLTDMELAGICLDTGALVQFSAQLEKDLLELQEGIFKDAGVEFNISSPKQLGEILYEHLKIVEKPKKTKTGQYSTSEDTISRLMNTHPIIEKILDFRQLNKLKSTYVDTLPGMVNPLTNRVHTSFNQAVAATGRLSSNNPNLQNIPIRSQRGKEVRKAFVPSEGNFILLAADYSQIELRIIAQLSGDEGMMQAFKIGEDIHSATASKVYDIPLAEVTADMRRNAKMVNFGIIYGISAFGLSQRLNISRGEAAEIIESYFNKYPGIKSFMDKSIEFARENEYVETIMGRRRYLRDINSRNATVRGFAERNAINAPIQGSAADMIKIAMINIHAEMAKAKLRSKMLLQVHDELVFDAHKDELDMLKPLIEAGMKNAIKMEVPIEVEMDTGINWLEAH